MTTTSRPEMDSRLNPWMSGRLAVLFLLSIPFFLTAIGCWWFWEFRQEEGRGRVERNLHGILAAWAEEAAPERAWNRILLAAEKAVRLPGVSLARQKAILRRLHQRFPGMLTFTVLDSQGRPIEALCDRPQPRVAWQRLDKAYRRLLRGDQAPWKALAGTVHRLLGSLVPIGRPLGGMLLRADSEKNRRWLFVGTPRQEGWFLATVAAEEGWFSFPLRDRIRRQASRPSATRFYLVPGVSPTSSDPELASAPLRHLWDHLNPFAWEGDRLWGLRRIDPRLSLVAVTRTSLLLNLHLEGHTVAVILGFGWLVTLFLAFHGGLMRSARATPIRLQLVVAVGFAALLPFTAIVIITGTFVREHSQKLEGDLFFRLENALHDLDILEPVQLGKQAKILFNRSLALSWPEARPAVWKKNLWKLRPLGPWDVAKIYGPDGQCQFIDTATSSIVWSLEDFLYIDKVAGQMLELLGCKSRAASSKKDSKVFIFSEMLKANFIDNFDGIVDMTAGGERYSMMLIPLTNAEGQVASMLHLFWNRWRLEQLFLKKYLLSFARDLPDTRLLVWRPNAPDRWFPMRSPLWKPLARLFPAIRDHTGSFGGRVRIGEDDFLVTAIRSEAFQGSFLIAVTSDRFIRTEIRGAIFRLLGGGLLLAFGSILAARIFAQSFLRPLSLLGLGISALRVRDFTVRLPEAGRDELGNLIVAFNRLADGLQDLEGASRVRAILSPPAPLVMPPFSFWGILPANETLGRQIFDFGMIDDNEVAFLIGTCHTSGVTASLALALAKGILSHPCTPPDPNQAFQELERTIQPILGEGASLDLIYGRLNLKHSTVRLAGRNLLQPILVSDGLVRSWFDAMPNENHFDSGIQIFPSGGTLLMLSGEQRSGPAEPLHLSKTDRESLAGLQKSMTGRSIEERTAALQAKLVEQSPGISWTLLLLERSNSTPGESVQ